MKKIMSMALVALFVVAVSGCCSMKGKKCCAKSGTCPMQPAAEKADM